MKFISSGKDISFLEYIGVIVLFVIFMLLLTMPGCSMSEYRKELHRKEIINDLCNKNKGKYDFCKLESVRHTYIEKIKKESK